MLFPSQDLDKHMIREQNVMSPQKELKCFFNVSELAFFLMLIT